MLQALLTNIRAIAGNRSVSATKEGYFDKKWGKNAGFKKNIEKGSYEIFQVDDQQPKTQVSDQILVLYKTPLSDSRNRFLSRMANDSIDFIEEQKEHRLREKIEEQLCVTSMAAMMEHVFEVIKSYSYELNNALGFGPLHVAVTSPSSVTEVIKFNKLRQAEQSVTFYRARLSTGSHSLVLRGDKDGIQFYVIPSAHALGLSKNESNFNPTISIRTRMVGGTVVWQTEGGASLTSSRLEVVCMNLFQQLIEDTKSQLRREQQGKTSQEQTVAS